MTKQHLLEPVILAETIQLNNRVVMAPMTRSRADNSDNAPTNELHGIYSRKKGLY